MESATLPALVHGCERLILIGDQNQLPPVVSSPLALEHGLGVSLFARLAAGGMVPSLLNEQYRMHPKIAEFPSNRFYGGRVKSKVDPDERPLPKGYRWPNRRVPVVFIDVSPDAVYAPAGTATDADADGDGGDDVVGRMLGSDDAAASGEGSGSLRGLSFRDMMELPSPPPTRGTDTAVNNNGDVTVFRGRPDGVETIIAAPGPRGRVRSAPISGGFESASNASQTSYYNEAEAEVLVSVVESLVEQGHVRLNEIGVITPYNAQVMDT